METGRLIWKLAGHDRDVRTVAVAPNGRTAYTGGGDGALRAWDIVAGQALGVVPGHHAWVQSICFSRDGTRALSASWDSQPIVLWDVAKGQVIRRWGEKLIPVCCAALAPDGRQALSSHGDGLVRLWDTESGRELRQFKGHAGAVFRVTWTPDGTQAVSGGEDGTVRTWDVATGKEVGHLAAHQGSVTMVAVTPDGQRVVSCGDDGLVIVSSVREPRILASFEGHEGTVRALAISPDGRRALSGGADKTVRLWDLTVVPAESAVPKVDRLAVMDFANHGPAIEIEPLCKAMAEMLAGDLSCYPGIRVLERARVQQFLTERDMSRAGLTDAASTTRAGHPLGADLLLTGSFAGTKDHLTVEAVLSRPGQEQPLGKWTILAPQSGIFDLEQELTAKVLEALGRTEKDREPLPEKGPSPSPTVAVLPLRDLSTSAQLKGMGPGYADLLQAALAAIPGTRLVEREKLAAVLREQSLALSGLADAETAVQVGRLVGAERLLSGSFLEVSGTLRMDVRMMDTGTGSVLRAESRGGPATRPTPSSPSWHPGCPGPSGSRRPRSRAGSTRALAPARKLESITHMNQAEAAFDLGRYTDACEGYRRALLLDPDNHYASFRLAIGPVP